jgi:two-component system OmpR family sensor kinase
MKRFWRGVPLRIRLIAAVVALSAAGLALTGVVATAALHSYLVQRVDNQLESSPPVGCDHGFDDGPGRGGRQLTQFYLAELQPTGAVICHTLAPSTDASPSIAAHAGESFNSPYTTGSVDSGPSWRVLMRPSPDGNISVVATPISDVNRTVGRLVALETVIGLAVLVLIAGAGYVVIRRSLRPLVDVETTAVAIAGGDLSRRVPDLDPRTEVGRLTSALNAMLGQIEHAFARQRESEQSARASEDRMRRFVADASHELRTPLTSIRGFAELHRQGAVRDPKEVARLMRRVEDEAMRMGMLVDDLLLLARMDQERPLQVIPVDLLTVVADVVHDARAVAPDRAVELEVQGAPPIVSGDDARLHQVVQNLVTNALRHTPADSPIEVRLRTEGRGAVVDIVDHGPGLAPQIRDRVFERFYRVESSRTRDAGGAGLGLSIVAALVNAHGGSVRVDETPGGGATFRVLLPLLPAHSDLPAGSQDEFSDSAESGSHG